MNLYLLSVFCAKALRMAVSMVRTRFLQGMTTLASYSNSPASVSVSLNSGSRYAPTAFRCSVTASSISVCTSRFFGST